MIHTDGRPTIAHRPAPQVQLTDEQKHEIRSARRRRSKADAREADRLRAAGAMLAEDLTRLSQEDVPVSG